ncbi:MAG: hypothetical protein WC736_04730 [Gallionella sp.]|jgi:hypothetical protein
MELNNREFATLIWMAIFIGYVFFKDQDGRATNALIQLLRAFLSPKIIMVVAWATFWIALCVWALHYAGAWEFANLKTTLLWGVAFAFVTVLDVGRISEDHAYFRKTVRDTVSVAVVLTFIAEAYSFSLASELILIPLLTMMSGVKVISENHPTHAQVGRLATAILIMAGVAYVINGLYCVASDFQTFATWNTVREFFIPIVLSLLFLSYLYVVSVVVSYEKNFVALQWAVKDDALRRYAKVQAITRFCLDLDGLRRWKRHVCLFHPISREDIRRSIDEIKANQIREIAPPSVSRELGWCPTDATQFLKAYELETCDYHRIDDGQWWANSPMRELSGAAIMPDNIAYYIEGDEKAVKCLKVKLNVNDRLNGAASDSEFQTICAALLKAADVDVSPVLQEQMFYQDDIDVDAGGRRVRVHRQDFVNPAKGYSRKLAVDYRLN